MKEVCVSEVHHIPTPSLLVLTTHPNRHITAVTAPLKAVAVSFLLDYLQMSDNDLLFSFNFPAESPTKILKVSVGGEDVNGNCIESSEDELAEFS